MELTDALGSISEIRAQLARTETFRGFRSLTVGCSGLLGVGAALLQWQTMQSGTLSPRHFVELWVGVALISLLVVGAELIYRCSVDLSPLRRRLTILTLQQFAPCLVAGAAVTATFATAAPELVWMLPGVWAILFSLGMFATCRLLPRATFGVAVYYMLAGIGCLSLGTDVAAWSPWMMLGTFGVGQLLAAGVLYVTLERAHAEPSP